jgi:hypothetical protein
LRKCLRNIVMYTVLPFETELEENQRDWRKFFLTNQAHKMLENYLLIAFTIWKFYTVNFFPRLEAVYNCFFLFRITIKMNGVLSVMSSWYKRIDNFQIQYLYFSETKTEAAKAPLNPRIDPPTHIAV